MKTIFKYILTVRDVQAVPMHKGAEIISVQMQLGEICVWAIVEDPRDSKTEERIFVIRGTGRMLPADKVKYLATVQQGIFVWHIFEV